LFQDERLGRAVTAAAVHGHLDAVRIVWPYVLAMLDPRPKDVLPENIRVAAEPPALLMVAVHNSDIEMFEFFLQYMSDFNSLQHSFHFVKKAETPVLAAFFRKRKATPLMAACAHGNVYFVQRLLEHDACVYVSMAHVGWI
jgi:hypothetical protein